MTHRVNLSFRFSDDSLINRVILSDKIINVFTSYAFYLRDKEAILDVLDSIKVSEKNQNALNFNHIRCYDAGIIICDFKHNTILDMSYYNNVELEVYSYAYSPEELSIDVLEDGIKKKTIDKITDIDDDLIIDSARYNDSIPLESQLPKEALLIHYQTGCLCIRLHDYSKVSIKYLKAIDYPLSKEDIKHFYSDLSPHCLN